MMKTSTAKQILLSYNMKVPRGTSTRRLKAERILSLKLCLCLKKLEPKFGTRAIGICTKSIYGKRGLTRGKFKCGSKKTVRYRKKK